MSDTDTNEDVQHKVTKSFKNDVLKWVDIDDQLKMIRNKVKELNEEKKEYEGKIINFLTQVNEETVVIKDGKLSKNVMRCKAPLKKETIHKSLVELVGDTNKAMTMTEHIINSREITEKIKLSRTKNRS
jgi:hypothetical protein